MIGGINPAQMQGMMKKMGISQTPLNVNRVIFEMDGEKLIIDEPSVIKIMMQGQETYQVSGEAREESAGDFSDGDVSMVVEKTGRSEEEVRDFLEKNSGDIALAIIELK
jgi:nascent polypeptide-associated complex subunit alpha|tara:strand:+ start:129 stop:455 length:327 start_codon:yes stop_codon:yes gene_type:complete